MYKNTWITTASCSKDIKKAFQSGLIPDVTILCHTIGISETAILSRDGNPLNLNDVVVGLFQFKAQFANMDIVTIMVIPDGDDCLGWLSELDLDINNQLKNNQFTEQDFLDLPWEEIE